MTHRTFVLAALCWHLKVGVVGGSSCSASVPDFPECDAPEATTQRIRYEIRDLAPAEWQAVVDAFWIMKNTSLAAGRAMYGPSFRTWDYIVVKHAVGYTDRRGDQGHMHDGFINYHSALSLEVEQSIMAIDPSIEALPYWDVAAGGDAFDAVYFGSAPGTGEGNTVVDGPFANWPITKDFDITEYESYLNGTPGVAFEYPWGEYPWRTTANTGFLRASPLTTPYITRFGNSLDHAFTAEQQQECAEEPACWSSWNQCIMRLHAVKAATRTVDNVSYASDTDDLVSSPMDLPFFPFHANLDRNKMKWMANHPEEAGVYYGYSGQCQAHDNCVGRRGTELDSVISQIWKFSSADLGLTSITSDALTHADLLCHLRPESAPYRYAEPGSRIQ